MTSDLETRISPDGIFVSCFLEEKLLWEFHPDDITSVGIYPENGRMHELIVTLNHDFDLAEGTDGIEKLNKRLSKELNVEIRVDGELGTSPSGIVLWPPHLGGAPLWEFYIVEPDGLWRYVSADAPDALRTLYGPVRREMGRYAKVHLPSDFPQQLVDRGFAYHGEIGWYKDAAILAAEWLRGRGAAIGSAELWLVKNGTVQPHVKTALGVVPYRYSTNSLASETWESFANRTLNDATAFIRRFEWPANATESAEPEIRFCVTWVWKDWLEENGFRFPE
jgi:hypothetical protein